MNPNQEHYSFQDLVTILKMLRGENGCPWDRVQTHETIKMNMVEEAYEALEALDSGDKEQFADELGDLLLQVVFHAQIGEDDGTFTLQTVLDHISKKMISRHSHIFGEDTAETPDAVLDTWEKNKQKEKGQKSYTESMKSVCSYLPALIRAEKVQSKAKKVGFDWENVDGALEKLEEETKELSGAVREQNQEHICEELGDVLFSAVNVARFFDISAEEALSKTIEKFIRRFSYVENGAKEQGRDLKEMSLAEMDELWNAAKHKE